MKKILNIYRQFLNYIEKLEFLLGIAILIIIVALIASNVFARYILDKPIVWAEELAIYGYIWIIFIGSSIAFRQEKHIVIPIFYDKWSFSVRKVTSLITYLCIMLILLVLLVQGMKAASFQVKQHTVSLPIRLAKLYFFALPLILGVVSMIITATYQIVKKIYEMVTDFRVSKTRKFN